MISPFIVLGLPRDSTDSEIRERYLKLVRAHPPSRDPEQFQRVVAAYEAIKTPAARIDTMLFGAMNYKTFDDVVADLERAATPRGKLPGLRELAEAEDC